jgi:hypothetical protein
MTILASCLRDSHLNAVNVHPSIGPSIIRLLDFRRPKAILFAVKGIVIPSFEGMFWGWAIPHIFIKCFKASRNFVPSVADSDSTPAISMIVWSLRQIAPPAHIYPNTIDGRSVHAMGAIDTLRILRSYFARQASAAFRGAPLHIVVIDKLLGAASTAAEAFAGPIFKYSPSRLVLCHGMKP